MLSCTQILPIYSNWLACEECICVCVFGSRVTHICRHENRAGFSPSFGTSSVQRPHSQHHSGGSSEWATTPNPPGILGTFSLWCQVTTYTLWTQITGTHSHNSLHSSVLYFCCLYRVSFVSFPPLLPCLSFTFILHSHTFPVGWTTTWTNT